MQGRERFDLPATEDTSRDAVVSSKRVGVDPTDVVRFECLPHPFVKLALVTQIPDLDRQIAADVADDPHGDVQRGKESPASGADHDAAIGLPIGRWLWQFLGSLVEHLAKCGRDIRPAHPVFGPRSR